MASKSAELLLRIKTDGEEKLDSIGEMLTNVGKVGAIAFAAISAVVIKAVGDYAEQEQAVNSLTRAMVNNGTYSKELRDAYVSQSDALSKVTMFGDEQIIASQSLFTQQTKGLKLTQEMTTSILDFAQAQGIDASNAAELVAKSISSSNNALARYGIEVNTSASASERMSQVMSGLNQKFGGQAQAATEGLGSIKLLQKAVGEISEGLGERLAPTITLVAKELLGLVNNSPIIMTFLDNIGSAFKFLVKESLSVAYSIKDFGQMVGGTFGTLAGALSQIASGEFKQAGITIKDGFKSIIDESYKLDAERSSMRARFEQESFTSQQDQAAKEIELLKQTHENKKAVKEQAFIDESARDIEKMIEKNEVESQLELALLDGRQSAILQAQMKLIDEKLKYATSEKEKLSLLEEKFRTQEQMRQAKYDEMRLANLKGTLSTISTLSKSGNQTLAAIGKAAALTQIAIDTPTAISKALASAPPPC